MSKTWDDHADGWDSNEGVIFYANKAFESLIKVIDLDNMYILDFGSGTGLLTEKMSPLASHVVALDPSEKMISVLNSKKLPNVSTLAKPLTESLTKEHQLFTRKFNLIVASSVCAFLPSFEETLALLKTLLIPGGVFVQWDWLAQSDDAEFGLSENRVKEAYKETGLVLQSIGQPFVITVSEGENPMPVLMGVAKNPDVGARA